MGASGRVRAYGVRERVVGTIDWVAKRRERGSNLRAGVVQRKQLSPIAARRGVPRGNGGTLPAEQRLSGDLYVHPIAARFT